MKYLLALLTLAFACIAQAQITVDAPTAEPAKPYVRPGEPIAINFQSHAAGPATQIADSDGALLMHLYTFDGKLLEPKSLSTVKPTSSVVDISPFFPQLQTPGTYILTWKSATPLVIETLRNPLPWAMIMDPAKVPAAQRPNVIAQLKNEPAAIIHIVPLQYAVITTDKGVIKATFDYAVAPHTVDNFVALAKDKFYDGTNFHRIIKGFMIQGGDSLGNTDRAGGGGPGYALPAELSDKLHTRGTLSMARTSQLDSAGSQFFIIHGNAEHLNGQYSAFGQVISGLDVVDKIADTPTTDANGSTNPKDRPVIQSIRILPATADMYGVKAK